MTILSYLCWFISLLVLTGAKANIEVNQVAYWANNIEFLKDHDDLSRYVLCINFF